MSSNNIQETFFNLRTLTLRDRLPPRDDTENGVSSSRQQIYTQSPTPSQQTTLSKFRLILASNWKWIASFFVGASYIIFIVSLHAYNNQLIQNNSRLIQESLSASSAQATSESLTDHTHDTFKYLPVVQDTSNAQPTPPFVNLLEDSSGLKKLLLSASSQQSQINKLSKTQEELEAKIKTLEENIAKSSKNNNAVFEAFIRESNVTFCSGENEKRLIAPLSAIYRIEFSAKVHGHTYINRKMFQISKNTQVLRNGGVISGLTKTCFAMEETLLVNMNTADVLQLEDLFTVDGGQVYDFKFCMAISDRNQIPGNRQSLFHLPNHAIRIHVVVN